MMAAPVFHSRFQRVHSLAASRAERNPRINIIHSRAFRRGGGTLSRRRLPVSKSLRTPGAKFMNGVDMARCWASELVSRESKGPGDMENAMHRLETRYGIPWRTFWSLRYRPPPDIMFSVWNRLRVAYEADCARQIKRLEHEIEVARAIAPSFEHPALTSASASLDGLVAPSPLAEEGE